jgi:hypothetical protein
MNSLRSSHPRPLLGLRVRTGLLAVSQRLASFQWRSCLLASARAIDVMYGKHLLLSSVPTEFDTGRWKDTLLPSTVLCSLDRTIHGYLYPTSFDDILQFRY